MKKVNQLLAHPEPGTPKFAQGPADDERAQMQDVQQKVKQSKSKSKFAQQQEREQKDYKSDSDDNNESVSVPNSPNGQSLAMDEPVFLVVNKSKLAKEVKDRLARLEQPEQAADEARNAEELKSPNLNDSNGSEPKEDNGQAQKKLPGLVAPSQSNQKKSKGSRQSIVSRKSLNSFKNISERDLGGEEKLKMFQNFFNEDP